MVRRAVTSALTWIVGLGLLAGLLGGAYYIHDWMVTRRAAEAASDTVQVPKRAANNVVKLGATLAESHGIKDEPALAVEWHERVTAYGRVVPNPRATAEVRAAFGGTLRATSDNPWPAPGDRLRVGQSLGWLDVRVGPQERLDLQTKLSEARHKQRGAEEVMKVHQERVDRLRSAGAGVSQSELDTALTQLTEAQTQLATARAAVQEWENAQAAIKRQGGPTDATWSQPLAVPADGEVVDLAVRPGMAVEAGGLIVRLVDFRQVLVRLDVPAAALTAGPPVQVELYAVTPTPPALAGATNRPDPAPPAKPLDATLAGAAPQIDPASQMAGYWYEVHPDASLTRSTASDGAGPAKGDARLWAGAVWRPGLFIKAFVKVPESKPRPAVTVPEGALLYHQGRALVYVRLSPGRYERREVQVLGREGDRWVLAGGVAVGEPVVSRQAQVLLSEEFRGEADVD